MNCMHWQPLYERTITTVTRICPDCGETGTQPRCVDNNRKTGEQCSAYVLDGSDPPLCRVHAPKPDAKPRPECGLTKKDGTRCVQPPLKSDAAGRCYFHTYGRGKSNRG